MMGQADADTSAVRDPLRLRQQANVARTLLARSGLDRRYRKVFAIGFNKTATTSIHAVFVSAGLFATHDIAWRRTASLVRHYCYQGFSDGPPDDFTALDRHFPRSRFVLNVRNLDEWLDSRIEHIRYKHAKGEVSPEPMWQVTEEAITDWIRSRNAHHLRVLDHFRDRPGDLLVLNFIRDGDAARKLSAFIDGPETMARPYARPIPKTREAGRLRNRDLIARCLGRLGVPETEWRDDIHCRSLSGGVASHPHDTRLLHELEQPQPDMASAG